MMQDIQNSIIESIKIIAGERLKNINFTKSFTGMVKDIDLNNLICTVEVNGNNTECIIPHNLANYIWVDDIIIVQDISNNKRQKIVQGVISSKNRDMFHIYDPDTDTIISSIEQLWDEDLQMVVNVRLEIGE
jgi:hypothetical protein